ncbi:hypothetical protein P3T43_003353 [Paraburkholderia sp. GAS41]|uniref:hypothetical protein n=1 Tax=Paraburkholderia sp. GAS41 TaxID=3035134 RepID=UPI003D191801
MHILFAFLILMVIVACWRLALKTIAVVTVAVALLGGLWLVVLNHNEAAYRAEHASAAYDYAAAQRSEAYQAGAPAASAEQQAAHQRALGYLAQAKTEEAQHAKAVDPWANGPVPVPDSEQQAGNAAQ